MGNDLYHWGILGQKWGVRRYQNEDGTLTEEGKKRYSSFEYANKDDKKAKIKRTDAEIISAVYDQQMQGEKQIYGGVRDATNTVANMMPTGNGKTIRKDYSDLSDEELRRMVNRLSMEEQYGRLTGDTKYVKSGSEYAREVLQTAGAVAAIGVSAIGIMDGIRKFQAKVSK